jgi:hypothetical protein
MDEVELGKVKYGVDKKLEEEANRLLAEDAGENRRSVSRDVEKMRYEAGLISSEELHYYDPDNDWGTHDSAFTIYTEPSGLELIDPSICDGNDGNVRDRSRVDPKLPVGVWGRAGEEERRGLSRHVQDDDNWGSTREENPLLGVNEGPRKVCTQCRKEKGLQFFSPDARNRDGLRSWCKGCERKSSKIRYTRKSKE